MTADECAKLREMELNLENERKSSNGGKNKKVKPEAMAATTWRDLIPVIKIDICSVSGCLTIKMVTENNFVGQLGTICVRQSIDTNYIVDLRGRGSLCLQYEACRLPFRLLHALCKSEGRQRKNLAGTITEIYRPS